MSTALHTDHSKALAMMQRFGGGFVRSLADCYFAADALNRERLSVAFSDYFEDYARKYDQHVAQRFARSADATGSAA